MKKLKIYKSAIALLTSASIVLFSGCTGSEVETKKQSEPCRHLTIYFEEVPITFKECEGYDISCSSEEYSGMLNYVIYKDELPIAYGETQLYNHYYIYHSNDDKIVKNESVQKTK